MAQQVLIIGHSFVRYLKTHMKSLKVTNLGLDAASREVQLAGGIDRADKINLIHEASDRAEQMV